MIRVEAPDDPRLEPYRAVRDRDLARGALFLAEGEVVVRRLLAGSRFRPRSVLLDDTRWRAMEPFLATLPAAPPVLVGTRALLSAVAGFPVHRGCLAAAERGAGISAPHLLATLPPDALVLVAIGIANHDNAGALFRNAAAFGVDAVLLDGGSCDPLYRKAIRVSVGAALALPFAHGDSADAILSTLASAGFDLLAFSPGGRETLSTVTRARRTALVVGAEGPGLPPAVLERCRTVSIPMAAGFDSLNVATAAAIALHHLTGPDLQRSPGQRGSDPV